MDVPEWHFSPVILCASAQGGAQGAPQADVLELGPKAIVLIRTRRLPAWAQSTVYRPDEIHVGIDDSDHVRADMKALLQNGDACVMQSQVRFVHADVAVASDMLKAANDEAIRPRELVSVVRHLERDAVSRPVKRKAIALRRKK